MAKRAVIDTGVTMVAMITDILEHVEPSESVEVCVGDRVRITSGQYAGVVGEVKLVISNDDDGEIGPGTTQSRYEVA